MPEQLIWAYHRAQFLDRISSLDIQNDLVYDSNSCGSNLTLYADDTITILYSSSFDLYRTCVRRLSHIRIRLIYYMNGVYQLDKAYYIATKVPRIFPAKNDKHS